MSTHTTTLCIGGCGAVVPSDVRHCNPCRVDLTDKIRDAHGLLRELDTTLARQDRVAPSTNGRRSSDTPMAFHVGASDAATELRATIRSLARDAPNLATTHIRRFHTARTQAYAAIDIARGKTFCGACTCDTHPPLYAPPGADNVECRHCRTVWPAEEPDTWDYLDQAVGTLSEIREWFLVLGITRSKTQLARDVRGVDPAVTSPRGATRYRLTDVLTAYHQATARRTSLSA